MRSRRQRDPTARYRARDGVAGLRSFLSGGARVWAATPVSCASPASAQPEPTEYFVSLANRAEHLAHVSIRLPQGEGTRTLDMPVWNALYQVRNFAANVEDVRAQDASGAAAQVRNTTTSEWNITAPRQTAWWLSHGQPTFPAIF